MRPHRWQPTRLPCPWDSPGKNTGVGCHFLLQCVKVKLLSRVRLLATAWTAAYHAPLPMGFSRQEYWSGVPLPSPEEILVSHNWKVFPPLLFFGRFCEGLILLILSVIGRMHQRSHLQLDVSLWEVLKWLTLFFCYSLFRKQWHPIPVLLPGKSHGRRGLVGYSPWGC